MTNKIAWEKWDDIDLPQLDLIDEKEDMFFYKGAKLPKWTKILHEFLS